MTRVAAESLAAVLFLNNVNLVAKLEHVSVMDIAGSFP